MLFALVAVSGAEAKLLTVQFFDVGQADAILITCPTGQHEMLIDAGDTRYPGSSVSFRKDLEESLGGEQKRIDVAVASHPHADHIGSMEWVLEHYLVGVYVDNGQKTDAISFARLNAVRRKLVEQGKLSYLNAKEGAVHKLAFCPLVKAETVEPWALRNLPDTNDRSVAVRIAYGNISFLFVGDCEKPAEKVLLNSLSEAARKDLDVDVLKVGHHGSDTSSMAEFIAAVSPEIAVVSCGKKGVGTNIRYKHPRLSTVRSYGDWFTAHPPPTNAPAARGLGL